MPRVCLNLKGMHCPECVSSIEYALYQAGIKHFQYDVVSHFAKIYYEDDDVSLIQIADAIHRVGYDLDVMEIEEC